MNRRERKWALENIRLALKEIGKQYNLINIKKIKSTLLGIKSLIEVEEQKRSKMANSQKERFRKQRNLEVKGGVK